MELCWNKVAIVLFCFENWVTTNIGCDKLRYIL